MGYCAKSADCFSGFLLIFTLQYTIQGIKFEFVIFMICNYVEMYVTWRCTPRYLLYEKVREHNKCENHCVKSINKMNASSLFK